MLQGWAAIQTAVLVGILLRTTLARTSPSLGLVALVFAVIGIEEQLYIFNAVVEWLSKVIPIQALRDPTTSRLAGQLALDVLIVVVGSAVLVSAYILADRALRRQMLTLSVVLAIGFAFGGVIDFLADASWSTRWLLVEELGEALAMSLGLTYSLFLSSSAFRGAVKH
jgi:hypothetical protein